MGKLYNSSLKVWLTNWRGDKHKQRLRGGTKHVGEWKSKINIKVCLYVYMCLKERSMCKRELYYLFYTSFNATYIVNKTLIFCGKLFGMAAMPVLCNGILLFQCHLPRVLREREREIKCIFSSLNTRFTCLVLPVLILKYASCLILSYIVQNMFEINYSQ